MKTLSIIGSSNIVDQHIECAEKCGFTLKDICTTNKKSKNISYLIKKYDFKNVYFDWKKMLKEHKKKNKNEYHHYLIAPRIKDTDLILSNFINLNKKILVEKPISLNSSTLKKYYKFNNYIHVGYNRIFYESILNLKKLKIKKSLIRVFLPENNIDNFKKNSCHIISILVFLFGEIKLINKIKTENFIVVNFEDQKKNLINLEIFFKASDNFSLTIYNKKNTHLLKPIENYKYYNDIKRYKLNKDTLFIPKLIKSNNEFKKDKFKPGFLKMWKSFKMSDNKSHPNNIIFAYRVMKICEKIIK